MKENIFADLYNKVMSFFVNQQETEEKSKLAAMSRLKTVLMQDRAGFSERAIQMLKDDMIKCIAKYMEIEEESFDLQINPQEDKTVLEIYEGICKRKGCLIKGGDYDYERAGRSVIDDFRKGRLGKICLEGKVAL